MLRLPRPAIGSDVSARYHNRVSLDRLFVNDRRMTGRASLSLPARAEGLHVLAMAHDQADILHWRRQVANGDLRDAQDVAMASQTYSRVYLRFEVMRLSRRAKEGDGDIPRPMPSLIVQPADDTWSDMARHALYFFVR